MDSVIGIGVALEESPVVYTDHGHDMLGKIALGHHHVVFFPLLDLRDSIRVRSMIGDLDPRYSPLIEKKISAIRSVGHNYLHGVVVPVSRGKGFSYKNISRQPACRSWEDINFLTGWVSTSVG